MTPRRARAAAALAVVAGVVALPAFASPSCLAGAAAWRWQAVGLPDERPVLDVQQLDDDPCRLLATTPNAVWRSTDGGGTWQPRLALGGAARVFAEGLGPGRAIVGLAGGGARVTRDGGDTFAEAAGLPPARALRAATAAPGDADTVLVAVEGPGPTTLYGSDDGGDTFTVDLAAGLWAGGSTTPEPVPDTEPVRLLLDPAAGAGLPTSFAVGSRTPGGLPTATTPRDRVWWRMAGEPTWRSNNLTPGRVTDLALTRTPGGFRVWAATSNGLFRAAAYGVGGTPTFAIRGFAPSRDHPPVVTGVRAQWGTLDRVLAVVDGRVLTSGDDGVRFTSLVRGLPGDCRPASLRASTTTPTSFLAACGGTTYRLMSSTVAPPADPPVPVFNPQPPAGTSIDRTPLVPLRVLPVPERGRSGSGHLAFDGEALVYAAPGAERFTFESRRMSTLDGTDVGPAPVHGSVFSPTYTYDRRRHALAVFAAGGTADPDGRMTATEVDLATGGSRALFKFACDASCRWAYDLVRDDYWLGSTLGRTIAFVDRTGVVRGSCAYGGYAYAYPPIDNGPKPDGARAIVALGDGTALVDWADGATIVRIDRSCRMVGVYSHPATAGTDSALACDSATFGVPAVWLRTSAATMTAFRIPAGACGSRTRLALAGATRVRAGATVTVCARLTLPSGVALPAQPVSLAVGGVDLGTARTDVRGGACRPYRAPARATSYVVPVTARYPGLGFAYDPSNAAGQAAVLVPAAPVAAGGGVPARPPVAVAGVPAAPAGPPVPAQPQVPQTQPQPQVQSQAQSQGQSQTQAQPGTGVAVEEQERVQVAQEEVTSLAASRPRDSDAAAAALQCAAAAVACAAAASFRLRSQRRSGLAGPG
jgi:hypothetical protein